MRRATRGLIPVIGATLRRLSDPRFSSSVSLGSELVPELVQGEFFVNTELPPGTHLELNEKRMQVPGACEAMNLPGVTSVYTVVGSSNEQGGTAGELRENIGQLTMTVTTPSSLEERRLGLMESFGPSLEAEGDHALPFRPADLFQLQDTHRSRDPRFQLEPADAAR